MASTKLSSFSYNAKLRQFTCETIFHYTLLCKILVFTELSVQLLVSSLSRNRIVCTDLLTITLWSDLVMKLDHNGSILVASFCPGNLKEILLFHQLCRGPALLTCELYKLPAKLYCLRPHL